MMTGLLKQVGPTDGTLREVCQCLPGLLAAGGHEETVRGVLVATARLAKTGFVPAEPGAQRPKVEALGNLWWVHAAVCYWRKTRDEPTWRDTLLPLSRRIVQGVIGGKFREAPMGDGGTLNVVKGQTSVLALNAVWYNALETLAAELRLAGDPAGDHFERLAGRFRRSFMKTAWCDAHVRLCPPEALAQEDHAAGPGPLDVDQLLVAVLPESAVPRTRQRQLVDTIRHACLEPLGVRVVIGQGKNGEKTAASPLHLAWLAEGHVRTSDTPATAVAEAQAMLAGAHSLLASEGAVLARHYQGVDAVKIKGKLVAHGPTMAEVRRVWKMLGDAAERGLGNSKRSRITEAMGARTEDSQPIPS